MLTHDALQYCKREYQHVILDGPTMALTLPVPDLPRIYRSLQLIRRAEEEITRIYPTDKIKSQGSRIVLYEPKGSGAVLAG